MNSFYTELRNHTNESNDSTEMSQWMPSAIVTDYFLNMIIYTKSTWKDIILDRVATNINKIVEENINQYQEDQVLPIALMIFISLFIPLILYLTYKATLSMLT